MISIINGANLNLQGQRQPEIYGSETFEQLQERLAKKFPNEEFRFFQSNSEGEIIDYIHSLISSDCKGVIINPGAYAHYSLAIADALRALNIPKIEVHISNIFARDDFRHVSVTAPACKAVISGLGLEGYILAAAYLMDCR